MKKARSLPRRLAQMALIERMERGTVCRLQGRRQYNHQTWQDGRNVVRYVPAAEVAALREALAGYARFKKLADAYADTVIRRTRRQRARTLAQKPSAPRPTPSPRKETALPPP